MFRFLHSFALVLVWQLSYRRRYGLILLLAPPLHAVVICSYQALHTICPLPSRAQTCSTPLRSQNSHPHHTLPHHTAPRAASRTCAIVPCHTTPAPKQPHHQTPPIHRHATRLPTILRTPCRSRGQNHRHGPRARPAALAPLPVQAYASSLARPCVRGVLAASLLCAAGVWYCGVAAGVVLVGWSVVLRLWVWCGVGCQLEYRQR